MSTLDDLYKALLDATATPLPFFRFYMGVHNILNTLAVFHNLRPGAMLQNLREDSIDDIIPRLFPETIKAVRYPIGSNIILVRRDRPDLVELVDHLDKDSPEFDTNVGKILGYFTPYNIHSKNAADLHLQAVQFNVVVRQSNGMTASVQHFEQRVSTEVDVSAALEEYKTKLLTLPMPSALRIRDVKIQRHSMPIAKSRKRSRKNKRRHTRRRR